MKVDFVGLAAVILVAATSAGHAASETIIMNSIDANGVGKKVGTLDLSDTKAGLLVIPRLTELPPGDRGFHVHVNPDCGPGGGPNGQPAAGMAAPHLTLADAKGRAIVIHAGGDNYSDQPEPLGGGGARIACGVVK